MNDGWRIVFRVLTIELWIGDDGRTQHVFKRNNHDAPSLTASDDRTTKAFERTSYRSLKNMTMPVSLANWAFAFSAHTAIVKICAHRIPAGSCSIS